jgi:hypothetical protein
MPSDSQSDAIAFELEEKGFLSLCVDFVRHPGTQLKEEYHEKSFGRRASRP